MPLSASQREEVSSLLSVPKGLSGLLSVFLIAPFGSEAVGFASSLLLSFLVGTLKVRQLWLLFTLETSQFAVEGVDEGASSKSSFVGLKKTWVQKLSSDLLLTFMTVHPFQLGALLLATLEKFLDLFGFVWFGRNLSYTSVSCAPRSSEFRHYCVSDRTHCSADAWVVVLHVSISTSSWEWGPVTSTPPTSLGSDCSYMWRNVVQTDGGIAYSVAAHTQGSRFLRCFCCVVQAV